MYKMMGRGSGLNPQNEAPLLNSEGVGVSDGGGVGRAQCKGEEFTSLHRLECGTWTKPSGATVSACPFLIGYSSIARVLRLPRSTSNAFFFFLSYSKILEKLQCKLE